MNQCLVVLTIVLFSLYCEGEIYVQYRASTEAQDARQRYPKQLLQTALDKIGKDYRLTPNKQAMPQSRALDYLKSGNPLDVIWTMTTRAREEAFSAVRIPIYKGLIGWRLLLINPNSQRWNPKELSLNQLRKLQSGQVYDWPDYEILRSNHFNVLGSASYSGLFEMISAQRIDFFPRSIVEIWQEAQIHKDQDIVVDSQVVLHYPTAVYFFVHKSNTVLAKDIETGLEMMIQSGEFNLLFDHYYRNILKRSEINKRTVFKLNNPLLPTATPLHRSELWYHPK
jgi:hypothetical protein